MSDRDHVSARPDRRPAVTVLVGMLAVGVVAGTFPACDWRDDRSSEASTASAEQATATPSMAASPTRVNAPARPASSPRAADPSPEPLVGLATADAARRTGTGPDEVRIVLVEARDWPDRSLGCPRPGMGYAQAITPGFLIVLEVGGQRLEYHTDHAQVVLCAS